MALRTSNFKGFTIVELLIVIVVIAILASISIVSYNGIQKRAQATAAQSNSRAVATKAEMANTFKGSYPTTIADFNENTESRILNSGLKLVAPGSLTSTTGKDSVSYEKCTGGGTALGGARVGAFDYETGSGFKYIYLGAASATATCTGSPNWTAVVGS